MFTGIIEAFGTVKSLEKESTNLHITLESDLAKKLKIDQDKQNKNSLKFSHNKNIKIQVLHLSTIIN